MVSADIKIMVWLPINNNSFSSFVSQLIAAMSSIIYLISCNTLIYYVDSNSPYFYVFLFYSYSMPEYVSYITAQPIIIFTGDQNVIMIF